MKYYLSRYIPAVKRSFIYSTTGRWVSPHEISLNMAYRFELSYTEAGELLATMPASFRDTIEVKVVNENC